ncbi:MAG: hypothetical protein ABEJ86_01530 [Halococcoides sp.]
MHRRTVITSGIVAGSIWLAGCGETSDEESPTDQAATTGQTDRRVTAVEITQDPPAPDVDRSGLDSWGRYIASAERAAHYFASPDGSGPTVVENTDFTSGERLLYVQVYARQTCYRLRLDGTVRVDEGPVTVPVATQRTVPDTVGCAEAMTPVDLLVRLSFDPDGTPAEKARVVIDDEGDRETLHLDAER